MKLTLVALAILSLSAFAHADENYYYCTNLDASSSAAQAVLAMATSDGLMGMFSTENWGTPRAMFDAPSSDASNPIDLKFGAVQWTGGSNGYSDFQSAEATFNAQDAISGIKFTFDGVTAAYGNCVIDAD